MKNKNKRKAFMTIIGITLYQVTQKQLLTISYAAIVILIVVAWAGRVTGYFLSNELLSLLFVSYIATGLISDAGVSMIDDGFRAATLFLIYVIILSPFILILSKGLIFLLG